MPPKRASRPILAKPPGAHPRLTYRIGKARNTVGERIRSMRMNRKMTQEDLAGACQRLGWRIGRVIVAKLEMGEREVTDLELTILAKALGVKVGDLFD